jgi:hypothetical protein
LKEEGAEHGVTGGVILTAHHLPRGLVMETLGAAVGMLVGLAALAIALWELPKFRQVFFRDYPNFIFCAGVTLLLGGWVGYWIFATLFRF